MVRRAFPVRTCVGCRQRAPASALLRVVAERAVAGSRLVPDPSRARPGRGAHLHLDPACLALAERRRAFGRALRLDAGHGVDLGAVRDYVDRNAGHHGDRHASQGQAGRQEAGKTDGTSRKARPETD